LQAANHGGGNIASGSEALHFDTGSFNVANGVSALYANTSGQYNTALGSDALNANTTGDYNLAIGEAAGSNLTTSSYNIDIGNAGSNGDYESVRIGTERLQTATYLAGVVTSPIIGIPVFITPAGKLGVFASSERYKTDIRSLDVDAVSLNRLRPVTFHLKTEPQGTLQYGLIAEEVTKVYPDLVVHNAEGQIDGVRYDELAPILLTQVQAQQRTLAAEDATLSARQKSVEAAAAHLAAQDTQFAELEQQFATLLQIQRDLQGAIANTQARQSEVAMR
jgi:hypothetical protein